MVVRVAWPSDRTRFWYGQAFFAAQLSDSPDMGDWMDRIDPKIPYLSSYFTMWYYEDFDDLSYDLDLLNDDDADILKEAFDLMQRVKVNYRTKFELDSL
jgi:hypothetical protein